jgi:hypothetical protein
MSVSDSGIHSLSSFDYLAVEKKDPSTETPDLGEEK